MIKLEDILSNKREGVNKLEERITLNELKKECSLAPKPRDFKTAIKRTNGINIIAEIKAKSPSTGKITSIDPFEIAKQYNQSNASSISVLTDEKYFGGSVEIMSKVKKITTKPILRKDFIIDEFQIYESYANGADAILLITSILPDNDLKEFVDLSMKLGIECLVECHTIEDIDRVPENVNIYGINNRDFRDLNARPDLSVTKKLIDYIPEDKVVVSESGINGREDIKFLRDLDKKVDAVLTGTAILQSKNIVSSINELFSVRTE